MSDTYSKLIYHIVFSTKNRTNTITENVESKLYKYISALIKGEGGTVCEINGSTDHTHMVIKLKPTHIIPDLLQRIKAHSSKWINENHNSFERFHWQTGYGIFSVSESQLDKVVTYVRHQKEHHRKMTFQEEFIALLDKHGVEYKPEYLW